MVNLISKISSASSVRGRKSENPGAAPYGAPAFFDVPPAEAPIVFDNTARLSVEDTLILAVAADQPAKIPAYH